MLKGVISHRSWLKWLGLNWSEAQSSLEVWGVEKWVFKEVGGWNRSFYLHYCNAWSSGLSKAKKQTKTKKKKKKPPSLPWKTMERTLFQPWFINGKFLNSLTSLSCSGPQSALRSPWPACHFPRKHCLTELTHWNSQCCIWTKPS